MLNFPKCLNTDCVARKYCQRAIYTEVPTYDASYQKFESMIINNKFYCLNKVIEPKDLTKINLKIKLGL